MRRVFRGDGGGRAVDLMGSGSKVVRGDICVRQRLEIQLQAWALVPAEGFRRAEVAETATAAQKRSPRIAYCAALIEPSAQVRRWEEGIASHPITTHRMTHRQHFQVFIGCVSLSRKR